MLGAVGYVTSAGAIQLIKVYKLLATPIQNTLSQLSQTIRFLVANDMLEGVELRPGQAEEQERERRKVVVIASEDEAKASTVVPSLAEGSGKMH